MKKTPENDLKEKRIKPAGDKKTHSAHKEKTLSIKLYDTVRRLVTIFFQDHLMTENAQSKQRLSI